MESYILKRLQSQNPEKEYPNNLGKKWTDEEDQTLLEELHNNVDINVIAEIHKRSIGGINARRKEIAYNMYCNNISMEEIIVKTKLDENQITERIKRRQHIPKKNETEINKPLFIENEIKEMNNEIKEMKNEIKKMNNAIMELVEMMKAVYVFEDA